MDYTKLNKARLLKIAERRSLKLPSKITANKLRQMLFEQDQVITDFFAA